MGFRRRMSCSSSAACRSFLILPALTYSIGPSTSRPEGIRPGDRNDQRPFPGERQHLAGFVSKVEAEFLNPFDRRRRFVDLRVESCHALTEHEDVRRFRVARRAGGTAERKGATNSGWLLRRNRSTRSSSASRQPSTAPCQLLVEVLTGVRYLPPRPTRSRPH